MANHARVTAAARPRTRPAPPPSRLRAVGCDETTPPGALPDSVADKVLDFLPPGATWLPAPAHAVPVLPGGPPMAGYLVLVPQTPPGSPAPAPARPAEGPVTIDAARRTALVDGRELQLTYLEFELLAHLAAHPHRVHTRDQLVTTVWGYGHVGDGRTVDVHVARLRRKLGPEHRRTIQTVRRVGYTYAP
ncbi:winged helix-turn-helix domain-containing protein [Streptomyces sp. PR69]|uniref:winged helix-turn-helix domain-containing protein n=1 Tax=Streptomyces sp. PR69 TaxID=2984950 RepID=UPI0022644E3C|nr:winged helix-turn-helix domain-containing protein [Streptomyces sp. PR69]